MNGSAAANAELVGGILANLQDAETVEMLVCPPFPYLAAVAAQLDGSRVGLGAQTLSEHEAGAFTGETSAAMIKECGCGYVLVGHSERRSLYGETNADVAAKYQAAQGAGLTPILCVGETREEREAGRTTAVIDEQLDAILDTAGIGSLAKAIVAYEPVWAIGTGLTASPEEAQEVHRHIRGRLEALDGDIAAAAQILYGGSCKGSNAAGLFQQADIDGGLIGGASLKAEDFLAIAEAAAGVRK